MLFVSITLMILSSLILVISIVNNFKLDEIMANVQDLQQKVADLQTDLDAKQQAIADAIAALEKTIADLQAQLANGATPEQMQTLSDQLDAIKTDLDSTPTA